MRRLVVKPSGWPCTLAECPPGLFTFQEHLGFKNEYSDMQKGLVEAFCGDSGEYFWGYTSTHEERNKLIVQPCTYSWEER